MVKKIIFRDISMHKHPCFHHIDYGEHQAAIDHFKHPGGMIQDFKKRFLVSFVLTLPILLLSPTIQVFFHYDLVFIGKDYVLFVLSTIIFFYGGWPFIKGFYEEISKKKPGMMTLVAMAIIVSYLYSAVIVFGMEGKLFFWELVTLINVMLLGHWIEMKSVLGASRSLERLVQLMPAIAHVVKGKEIKDISLKDLQIGNIVLVKPNEKIPADGYIMEGMGYLNESLLTGESKPVKKTIGDQVIGGAINGNQVLKVRIRYTGKDSYLSKVIQLVQQAQRAKSSNQRLADQAAKWLTFIALFFGLMTFLVWLLLDKSFVFSLERMVTVMVITCPHALGLAIPLVVAISITLSAHYGLLIRNRTAFENARKISTIVFDKTGTLTKGEFGITRYGSLSNDYKREDVLKFAGSLEQNSEHPIAVSIMKEIERKSILLLQAEDFHVMTGQGIQGKVSGKSMKIVSAGYLIEHGFSIPETIFVNKTETVVFVLVNNRLIGFIAMSDQIRPESYEAIKSFRSQGIKVLMITGDNKNIAQAVSEELNLDGYFAEILPHQKLEIIKALQEKNEFVAMTGDGINDAPALAQADVGIAIGSGTDIAAETADIILVRSNPLDIVSLISFGKRTYRKMIQNLIWATAYNTIAIPLAAGVLFPIDIVLNPAVGAILMSLSTIIVAINAQGLKKIK